MFLFNLSNRTVAAMAAIIFVVASRDGGSSGSGGGVSQNIANFEIFARDEDPRSSCGMRIVGSNSVLARGTNFAIARVGHCAYVFSITPASVAVNNPVSSAYPNGIAVIDASNLAQPELVDILRTPGAQNSAEAIHAVEHQGRRVLAVASSSGRPLLVDSLTEGKALEATWMIRSIR